MEGTQGRPPGLRGCGNRLFWRATKKAVHAGYPVKNVNLSKLAGNERLLWERCTKLQREMLEWLSNGDRRKVEFDGTIRTLLEIYLTDPKSSFFKLKHASKHPYEVYAGMMKAEIGKCRIHDTDGTDVEGWFEFWAAADKEGEARHIAKARTAIAVLKAAVTFGVKRRLKECAEFRAILSACRFEGLTPRDAVVTAEQVIAARSSAHTQGHPRAALCFALQFETTARQWDLKGQWLPLSDPAPSAVIDRGMKWIGAHWSNIDENLILRITPSKTERTTRQRVVADLRVCPMVMEELAKVPVEERTGPIITNPKTGRPYAGTIFNIVWRTARKAAKIDERVWNRDLRASGSTEARAAGAQTDDVGKLMGHKPGSKVTAKVYDRAALEAHRRIAKARKDYREKK